MLCRDCGSNEEWPRPGNAGRVPDQLCSRCGHLLGADDIIRRVLEKQSQLALFGLAGSMRPLLKRSPP